MTRRLLLPAPPPPPLPRQVRFYEDVVAVQGVDLAAEVSQNFGWVLDAGPRDIAIVFAFGVGLRVCAVGAMLLMNRDKKL